MVIVSHPYAIYFAILSAPHAAATHGSRFLYRNLSSGLKMYEKNEKFYIIMIYSRKQLEEDIINILNLDC